MTPRLQISDLCPTLIVEPLPDIGDGTARNVANVLVRDGHSLRSPEGKEAIAIAATMAAAFDLLVALEEFVAIVRPYVQAKISLPRMVAAHDAAALAIAKAQPRG